MNRLHALLFSLVAACGGTTPAPSTIGNEPAATEVSPDGTQPQAPRDSAGDGDGGAAHANHGGGGQDRDADGMADASDKCPDNPEDRDSFEDDDGCPDPDNDRDGILDVADMCPNMPEDRDGREDDDGCPDA